jgi:peptidoglycan-associated lipoprotein
VIGHTDTTGTSAGNFELGLRRANAIRSRLVEAGVDRTLIDVTSHGEADLLVKTADDVADPRNRRVEITIR